MMKINVLCRKCNKALGTFIEDGDDGGVLMECDCGERNWIGNYALSNAEELGCTKGPDGILVMKAEMP